MVRCLHHISQQTFGDFVKDRLINIPARTWEFLCRHRLAIAGWLAASLAYLFVVSWFLRTSSYTADPLTDTYLEMAGSLIAFTFAANALVRFRGTHDRISLILAFGFVLGALVEAGSSMAFYHGMLVSPASVGGQISLGWLAGRTLLAVLLLAALVVERRIPTSRDPGKEMAVATLIVSACAYLTSVFYFMLPRAPRIHPGAALTRPWDLVPAGLYLAASIAYGARLKRAHTYLDRTLFAAAILNVLCHVTITESQRVLDAPFTLAHVLMISSYAVVLGGALLDNAELFDQVSRLASTDALTGLANHRRLLEVLESEMQRSRRTGRSFAVLLFDLDGLKKINDKYGHLTGSRAIKRLGAALGNACRATDTAARYGGDEFALVLPEAGEPDARQAATRICDQLAHDGQQPVISVSVGVSVYPQNGNTIDKLLSAADRNLYDMKGSKGEKKVRVKQAHAFS